MEKEFVTYDQALILKELGFDEPCFYQYVRDFDNDGELIPIVSDSNYPILRNNTQVSNCSGGDCFAAPLKQQAFRWFDYSTDWSGFIIPSKEEGCFDWWIQNYEDPNYLTIESDDWYRNREEAELACLNKLIEIVKKK